MYYSTDTTHGDKFKQTCLDFLEKLLAGRFDDRLSIRLWDGTEWPQKAANPTTTVVIKSPSAFRSLFTSTSEVTAAEGFIYGDYDIEGDVETAVSVAAKLVENLHGLPGMLGLAKLLWKFPRNTSTSKVKARQDKMHGRLHSLKRDHQAITYHYNVSNEFYKLWLGRRMVYSCAYFETPLDDIDTAQERKLDYICRKLRLKAGEKLLDIGCGWGGLMMFAAERYGVDVTGVTLSSEQAALATARINEAGLAERCKVELKDYRELNLGEYFDKLVSVGMIEHVGECELGRYFKKALEILKPGGVFLVHGIARSEKIKASDGASFINTFVFPDGELTPINRTLAAGEKAGFEVQDIENLRQHYALTLRAWVRRLEENKPEALKYVNEVIYRIWRLYMSGSAYSFHCGNLNLYQTLLVKPLNDGRSLLPLMRKDWYD